jgi:hypothetical protein
MLPAPSGILPEGSFGARKREIRSFRLKAHHRVCGRMPALPYKEFAAGRKILDDRLT